MEKSEINGVKVAFITSDGLLELAQDCREQLEICDEVIKTGAINGTKVTDKARTGAEMVRGACVCLEKVALAAAEYEPARGDGAGNAIRYILAQLVNVFIGGEPHELVEIGRAVMVQAAEMKQGKGAIVDAMFKGRDSAAATH